MPTCVWCVLTYQGHHVELEEIIAACRLGPYGAADDLAIQGLSEHWDVEVVRDFDLEVIRDALQNERPLILTLRRGSAGIHTFAHAVVVRGITDDAISVMDPELGDYTSIPLAVAEMVFVHDFQCGFFIGGAPHT